MLLDVLGGPVLMLLVNLGQQICLKNYKPFPQ